MTIYGPTASTYVIIRDGDSALFVHNGITTEIPPDTINDEDQDDAEDDEIVNKNRDDMGFTSGSVSK